MLNVASVRLVCTWQQRMWPSPHQPPSKVYRTDEEPRSRNLGQFAYLPILVSILQATKITSVGRGRISKIYFKHKACFYFCKGNCIARQSSGDIIKHHVILQRTHMCFWCVPTLHLMDQDWPSKLLQAFEVIKLQYTVYCRPNIQGRNASGAREARPLS